MGSARLRPSNAQKESGLCIRVHRSNMAMNFRLAMTVELNSDKGVIHVNDWSDYALGRLKKQQDDQRLKDEKFVAKQKLLKSHGVPLWNEVRKIVIENLMSLNAKAGKQILVTDDTPNSILRVENNLRSTGNLLHITFDEETGKLEWDCEGKKSGSWELAVSDDGSVRFHWGMVPTTPASIAKQMLDALLFD